MSDRYRCNCLESQDRGSTQRELLIHAQMQDMNCDAWKQLLDLVDRAAVDGSMVFSPAQELGHERRQEVITLPPSISKLKSVKVLNLYGSNLVRIPPEIGEMTSLDVFDPYTSYQLHWFPYEITRCRNLKKSTVSTRALYGNYKYRMPFPRLPQGADTATPAGCSVCGGQFGHLGPLQYWVSLKMATDVLPLLVHACSDACISGLPLPQKGYIQQPRSPETTNLSMLSAATATVSNTRLRASG